MSILYVGMLISTNTGTSLLHYRSNRQEVETHIRAFGDAFRAQTFDAKALTTGGAATAHMVGWGAAHMAHFIESVSPVLTPDQRGKMRKSCASTRTTIRARMGAET